MKRRLLSIFMTVCMAVSLIPAAVLPAWAQTTQRSDWTGSPPPSAPYPDAYRQRGRADASFPLRAPPSSFSAGPGPPGRRR